MKKIIPVVMLLFVVFASFGQISVSESSIKTVDIGRYKYSDFNKGTLVYYIKGTDTTISMMCLNQKYKSLQEYSTLNFKGGTKEKDQLYTALMTCFSEQNSENKDYQLNIDLGKHKTTVFKIKKIVYIVFDNVTFEMTKDNINTLFGKA